MNNVLVTGGAGFIGSHLCETLLDLGCKVINIDNFNNFYDPAIKRKNIQKALQHPGYVLVEGDINDQELLDRAFKNHYIDTVVHLAALAGVRKSIENPLEYVDVDIKGTVNLLEFSRKYNIAKFVFASSSSVYGLNSIPFREDDPFNLQVSPYATAKRAGELFCETYNYLYRLPVVCLRFFTVYGPRQRPEMAIHNFTRLIDTGSEVPVFGTGGSSRDYTYISDIVDGITAAMAISCNFEIFNLGNSNPVHLDYLVDLIGRKVGKQVKRVYLPEQAGDVKRTYADISKARKMLGYDPRIDIEEGVERFVKWYRSES